MPDRSARCGSSKGTPSTRNRPCWSRSAPDATPPVEMRPAKPPQPQSVRGNSAVNGPGFNRATELSDLRYEDQHRTPRQNASSTAAAVHRTALLSSAGERASAYRTTDRVCQAEPTSMGVAATLGEIGSKGREVRDHRIWSAQPDGRPTPERRFCACLCCVELTRFGGHLILA
jgi:hypothetical protein